MVFYPPQKKRVAMMWEYVKLTSSKRHKRWSIIAFCLITLIENIINATMVEAAWSLGQPTQSCYS